MKRDEPHESTLLLWELSPRICDSKIMANVSKSSSMTTGDKVFNIVNQSSYKLKYCKQVGVHPMENVKPIALSQRTDARQDKSEQHI